MTEIPNLVTDQAKVKKTPIVLILTLTLVFAVLTGFLLSRLLPTTRQEQVSDSKTQQVLSTDQISGSDEIKPGVVYGRTDEQFKDSAEGSLESGGLGTEGTHKLTREGGDSQTVYLTSSVIDLELFVGKKVRVKGETFSAQKAGWFMDVGSVEVLTD